MRTPYAKKPRLVPELLIIYLVLFLVALSSLPINAMSIDPASGVGVLSTQSPEAESDQEIIARLLSRP